MRNAVCESTTIHTHCHCEEEVQADDAAIHRVSHNAFGLSVRLLVLSGRHGLSALAMTRLGKENLMHGQQNTFKKYVLNIFLFDI